MKKISAIILSLSMIISGFAAADAAASGIDDDLSDLTKIFSHSENVTLEESAKLGSYKEPKYATSGVGTMEIVYRLEDFANFEVVTLNYKKSEEIKFYIAETADGIYNEVSEYSKTSEELGSNWTKNIYFSDVDEGYEYFKIVINQTNARFIRLDNVKLLQNMSLQLEGEHFYDDTDNEVTDANMYMVSKMTLDFNQRVDTAGKLSIKDKSGIVRESDGEISIDGMKVSYTFDALNFDIYEFECGKTTTSDGKEYVYSKKTGFSCVGNIGEYLHFEDDFKCSDFVTAICDVNGNNTAPGAYTVISSDEQVIKVEDGNIVPQKAGKATLSAFLKIGAKTVKAEKEVTVCGAKAINIVPENISIAPGEEKEITAALLLDDGTVIPVKDNIYLTVLDESIVSADGLKLKGLKNGNVYIRVSVDYNGQIIEKNISVGVGEEARDVLKEVTIDVNRDRLYVGESCYAVLKYFFQTNGEMDLMAADVQYFSDNNDILSISDEAKVTANTPGTASIYAEVTIDGITVRSDKKSITVLKNTIDHAQICFDTLHMCVGKSMDIMTKTYNKTGDLVYNPTVKYTLSNDNFKIDGNTLIASKPGTTTISANVQSDGINVETKEYVLYAEEYINESEKTFNKSNDWSGTFDHSDGLIITSSLGMVCANVDSQAQNVVFAAEDEMIGVEFETTVIGEKTENDLQVLISPDNSEYEKISESDFSVTASAGKKNETKYIYSLTDEKLKKAKYVKIILDKASGSKQDIRLNKFLMKYNKAPQVVGVDTFAGNDDVSKKNIRKIVLAFSQNVQRGKLADIRLSDAGNDAKSIKYDICGNLLIIKFDELKDGEYTLFADGIENEFGLNCSAFEKKIDIVNEKIEVSELAESEIVSAKIINSFDTDMTVAVLVCVYGNDGNLSGIFADNNVRLESGINNYSCPKRFENTAAAKIFIWNNVADISAY